MGLETAMIAGIIAGGGAIIGGAVNALSQKSANATNVSLAREQMAYQTSEREAAQEYNSAENQRKRYEQAGINPYLAMGNITPGTSEAQTSPGIPQVNPVDYSGILNGLNAGVGMYQQAQEAEQLQLGTEMSRVDARTKLAEKMLSIEQQRLSIANSNMDYKTKQKALSNLDTIGKQLQTDLEFAQQTFNERKATIFKNNKLLDLDAKNKELQNQYQKMVNDMQPIQRKVLQATLSEIGSRIDFNNASSANMAANTAVQYAEEKLKKSQESGVTIDNNHKREFLKVVRDTAKQEFRSKKWDAEHPSYFDKIFASGQSLSKAMGGQKPVPDWQPEATSRW